MDVTPDLLDDYFARYGWTYSRESENTWITGVRTRISAFRIMVRLTDHWVFFIINPLVVSPTFPDGRLRLYYHALRYNLDMNFAKLGIDRDGDLFMAIEVPTESFAYSHFVDALDGISHHATMIYAELFGLSHNPEGTNGRYDSEFEQLDAQPDPFSFDPANNPFAAPQSTNTQLDLDDEEDDDEDEPDEDEDDIIIGGRRLVLSQSSDGSTKVEFDDLDGKDEGQSKEDPSSDHDDDPEPLPPIV
jgi:hypothetical protein